MEQPVTKTAEAKPPELKLSPELEALDCMIRLSFEEKTAPEPVIKAWDNFLSECMKWEEVQKAQGKK